MNAVLRYALYPVVLALTLAYVTLVISQGMDLRKAYSIYLAGLIGLLILTEALHPMRAEWKMTARSFLRRDLPFLLIGSVTLAVANAVGAQFAAHGHLDGVPRIDLPLVPAFLFALYGTDFLWYWAHRASHELRGPIGRFLWRTHAAHHLPQQVYVLMHAVAHPLNTIIVRTIAAIPLLLVGFAPEVVFLVLVFNNLQGIFSHLNVEIRAGWLNYVLTGTELHRSHHSADPQESKNYAAVVTLWDQLFGTFYYRPGVAPARLGVTRPEDYPQDQQLLKVLALPFSKG